MNIYTPRLIYYIYAYLRPAGTPYYIGKGKSKRAWDKNHSVSVPKDKTRIIILEANLTELGAFALERRMIRWYGRKDIGTGILRNVTDGGEGSSGAIHSEETKLKMSVAQKGRKLSEETRLKMSIARTGHIHSEETKLKMAISRKYGEFEIIEPSGQKIIIKDLKTYCKQNDLKYTSMSSLSNGKYPYNTYKGYKSKKMGYVRIPQLP
jgi:hypothetical protein